MRDHLNISVESLNLSGLNKEVVFSRRWVDILLTMLDTYSVIKFGWSLLTGGLCSEVVIIRRWNQSEVSNILIVHSIPPFQSTESRHPSTRHVHMFTFTKQRNVMIAHRKVMIEHLQYATNYRDLQREFLWIMLSFVEALHCVGYSPLLWLTLGSKNVVIIFMFISIIDS